MSLPGFTTHDFSPRTFDPEVVAPRHGRQATDRVEPALPILDPGGLSGGGTVAQRRAGCISDCIDGGNDKVSCVKRCYPRPVPYTCTPRDNTVNNLACNAGCDAWAAAAKAVCSLIPVPALAALCKEGVAFVAKDCKSVCPGPTICI